MSSETKSNSTSPLPTDSKARKRIPITTGVLDYFPDAIAAVAEVSFVGNQQHNPGQPMHWAREKSNDHEDCITRHLIQRGTLDSDGLRHSAKLAWRALAVCQLEIEAARDLLGETAVTRDEITQGRKTGSEGNPALKIAVERAAEDYYVPSPGRATLDSSVVQTRVTVPTVYLSAPMRKVKHYNFPALDAVRDQATARGYRVISPADIDRLVFGIDPINKWEEAQALVATWTPETMREVAARDLNLIFLLNKRKGDGMVMLPGWEASIGATAEFFVARWLGIPILRAKDFDRLSSSDVDYDFLTNTLSNWLAGEAQK